VLSLILGSPLRAYKRRSPAYREGRIAEIQARLIEKVCLIDRDPPDIDCFETIPVSARKVRSLSPISGQYMKFEFTSLRHAVSSAEKLWIFGPQMCKKSRAFATFATRSGPEKRHQREHLAPKARLSP
jgi:hypothetical protein